MCLSDCSSLYDHLHREGIPRTPADRRLAIDLAALRQSLREERWTEKLPLAWIPSGLQLGDILTKPQDPKTWSSLVNQKLAIPISIVEKGCQVSTTFRDGRKTSVKPCVNAVIRSPYCFYNNGVVGSFLTGIHLEDPRKPTCQVHNLEGFRSEQNVRQEAGPLLLRGTSVFL